MEFLGMIAVGVLGLTACGRLFGLLFKGVNRCFSLLDRQIFKDDD